MAPHTLDTAEIRKRFPAFEKHSGFIFGDNAGGSQILRDSIDRITDYLVNTNIQMGSDYMPTSTERCTKLAQNHAVKLFNAESPDEIVFGASSTQNLENLARGLEDSFKEGEEIIITGEHEANASPWKHLAERKGLAIKTWEPRLLDDANPFSFTLHVDDLLPLVTSKTRLVAFTACSNILGSVVPAKEMVRAIRSEASKKGHSGKLEIALDCVAYAPHKRMDVRDWDVDFCIMSFYKVYGPHISAMYVRHSSLTASTASIVHHFLSPAMDDTGYKLQPAGPGYESTWGTTAIVPYLESLTPAGSLTAAFEAMAQHDADLATTLLEYLGAEKQWKRGVRIVGDTKGGVGRMPTISFVVLDGESGKKIGSKALVSAVDNTKTIGIRFGHFYAYTLVSKVRPDDPSDGVVRISFVHYNTVEEVQKVIKALDNVLYSS